jgi:hypothetical protein
MNKKDDNDDFIDILAIRKATSTPPGLCIGLNKINPRYADLIVGPIND